jgi:hypothetical protein
MPLEDASASRTVASAPADGMWREEGRHESGTRGSVLAVAFALTVPYAGRVQATSPVGFQGVTIATGTFGEINVFNPVIPPDAWKNG